MEEQAAIVSLAALAQTVRLRIFRALIGAGPSGMTPGALSALLDVPASTLSFHLKELTHSGLVTQERESRHLIYRPSITQMNDLMGYLTAHCCQGTTCAATPAAHCADC
ncbi:helix-turn-helix transcriptional regulator [Rhizobacter sp. Root404]|uniref:ArsR/SmtB family transcription factor n=1 Tax=Rhizobacter sp. Root404 TaxID=1736528 RepID=UPI0006F72A7D|nr:helix-turn-helix domain-containing protein [Rhizobacter sp. Root404]KQW37526.1 ArsR family transcriptional regulator [Rhizobacter sp. Root404]